MSATYDKKDGFIIAPKYLNEYDELMIGAMFENQVDFQVEEIKSKIKEEKLLRNMCWVKIFLFPLQYPLTRLFLGKTLASDVLFCHKIYWKFLQKKINATEFKKELNNSLKKVTQEVR